MKVDDEVYLKSNPTMTGRLTSKREKYPVFCVLWSNGYEDYYSESELILASEYVREVPYKTLEDYENSLAEKFMPEEEPKGHPNASILMEIAKEAAINHEYWKEYEVKFNDEEMQAEWIVCRNESDLFYGLQNDINIRRKPRTIRIGNYDVPEPIEAWHHSFTANTVCIKFESEHGAIATVKALQELLVAKQ